MNPCEHFRTASSVTGLDSEGVCLTCGEAWSLEDIRIAVARSRPVADVTCGLCGNDSRVTGDDVYVLTNEVGMALVHDCPKCENTVHTPIGPKAAALLASAYVMFTNNLHPITAREIKAFEITLWGASDLVKLARGMAA